MAYSIMRFLHLLGLILIGAGLIGVWYADLRSHRVRGLPLFAEAVRQIAVFYDGLVVPGALLLLGSGTWLIVTITRLYFLRLRRLTKVALAQGAPTRELGRARREQVPTFTHFLDLPILFVIVALGAMRPNTWGLFWSGTILAIIAAGILTVMIPRLYPFKIGRGDQAERELDSA